MTVRLSESLNRSIHINPGIALMKNEFVLGLDSRTTGTKAIAWNRAGQPIAEGRSPISLSNPFPEHFEQESSDWWNAAIASIKGVLKQVPASDIGALTVTNQRETFVPINAKGEALRPAMLWLDERSQEEIKELSRDL